VKVGKGIADGGFAWGLKESCLWRWGGGRLLMVIVSVSNCLIVVVVLHCCFK
jgi:hypothetical protein